MIHQSCCLFSRGLPCPHASARALGIRIEVRPLPNGVQGLYDGKRILVRPGLDHAEERSTIGHELVHAERGDSGHALRKVQTVLDERDMERSVDEVAARQLIPLHSLAGTLAVAPDEDAAAADLVVDVDMLRARLDTLTPAERSYLSARLTSSLNLRDSRSQVLRHGGRHRGSSAGLEVPVGAGGGVRVLVPEDVLDDEEVVPAVEHGRGVGVPEVVHPDGPSDAGSLKRTLEDVMEGLLGDGLAVRVGDHEGVGGSTLDQGPDLSHRAVA